MTRTKIFRYLLCALLCSTIGCSKDEDGPGDPSNPDNFYKGAVTSATGDDLLGYWAIMEAEYEGTRVPVPINYANCGRDFFVYRDNGAYQEYLYTSSGCETVRNQLQWELDKGVITLSTLSGSSDDLVIIKLSATEFQFKARVDIDEDGELDVVVLIAKRYTPDEKDFYTQSFQQDYEARENNLIGFRWEAYDGFNTFDKYEIYRSSGENCSKSNAELIATITDGAVTEFTDVAPPPVSGLCYYIKIYTDQGLLGESGLRTLSTQFIGIDPVAVHEPTVSGNSIVLSWEASTSPYFSHYEVLLSNQSNFYDELQVVAVIDDKDLTTYTDDEPPYMENPFYAVRAYNIFGGYSRLHTSEATSFWEVPFKRDEILPFFEIYSYALDTAEPTLYFYGSIIENGVAQIRLLRYNYDTQETESVADFVPSISGNIPIQVVSGPNGKEVVLSQGGKLHFYDALTMEYKYAVVPEGIAYYGGFGYNSFRDVWVLMDSNQVYTMQRDNATLFLIDQTPHYDSRPGLSGYQIIELKNGQVLMGHSQATTSFLYTLDDTGNIQESQSVNIQFRWRSVSEYLLYNSTADILLDTAQNRFYSSVTFQYLNSFGQPDFPSGISTDGTKVFGTNNDPDWLIEPGSLHKKEVVVYDRNTSSMLKVETIGYPHIVFENYNGEIISISSGFKKDNLYENVHNKSDFFVEKVMVP